MVCLLAPFRGDSLGEHKTIFILYSPGAEYIGITHNFLAINMDLAEKEYTRGWRCYSGTTHNPTLVDRNPSRYAFVCFGADTPLAVLNPYPVSSRLWNQGYLPENPTLDVRINLWTLRLVSRQPYSVYELPRVQTESYGHAY